MIVHRSVLTTKKRTWAFPQVRIILAGLSARTLRVSVSEGSTRHWYKYLRSCVRRANARECVVTWSVRHESHSERACGPLRLRVPGYTYGRGTGASCRSGNPRRTRAAHCDGVDRGIRGPGRRARRDRE